MVYELYWKRLARKIVREQLIKALFVDEEAYLQYIREKYMDASLKSECEMALFEEDPLSEHEKKERLKTCWKERKSQFGGNLRKTKDFCEQLDFENEKVEEMTEGFEEYLNVTKRFPFAFPHPIFDYEDENEKRIFFDNAMTIYNNAKTMSRLQCDEQCERRLDIALKSGKRTPFVLGRELQQFDAGEEIYLKCHLYLGLGNSTARKIKWWHNSSALFGQNILQRNILVEDQILLDVIKESRLIIQNASFDDAGTYKCSTVDNRKVVKSLGVTVKVLPRKYK